MFHAHVDSQSHLEPVVKFTYLQNCLEGEAKDLIKSLALSDANYTIAVDLLRQRYENKEILRQSLLHQLHSLPSLRHDYHDLKALHAKFTLQAKPLSKPRMCLV